MNLASNEIWYTNGSTIEATNPTNIDAFGADIISNQYSIENRCWIITFANNISTIGPSAFINCLNLTAIKLPDSIKSIEYEAFGWCDNLIQVITGDGIIKIGNFAFRSCKKLRSISLGSNLISIGDYAFYYCRQLNKVSIPQAVINIGKKAFKYCYKLSQIDIGFNVRIIGEEAFCECLNLTNIIIPYSVGIIESKAFYCCPISSVQCMPQIPPLCFPEDNEHWNLFFNNDTDFKIYVQTDSLEIYKTSEPWNIYADHIIGHDFRKKGIIR